MEVSWLAPVGWHSKVTAQVMSRQPAEEGKFALFPAGGTNRPLYLARLENLFDLSEDTTLQIGLSGALSDIDSAEVRRSHAGGVDVTLKHVPTDQEYRSLTWQTEGIVARQHRLGEEPGPVDLGGWYSFLRYRFDRSWAAGVRYGETDLAEDPTTRRRRLSALLEWLPSEWNALRFQFDHNTLRPGSDFQQFQVQWNVFIGPHGAHEY